MATTVINHTVTLEFLGSEATVADLRRFCIAVQSRLDDCDDVIGYRAGIPGEFATITADVDADAARLRYDNGDDDIVKATADAVFAEGGW